MKENTINVRSVLAKLLAKENITVQHGNYSTAFFDVKSRTLGLPVWKDKGKDVYDLLVGHEVGHALYTPMFDPKALKAPMVYMNVVEDIRIERLIQSTYPGLIRCFNNGYSALHADNFFGINGKDLDSLTLPDRINLKAKLGDRVSIQFAPNEAAIVKQCFEVETWQDTQDAAEALYKFCKSQANKKPDQADEADQQQDSGQGDDDNSQEQSNDPTQNQADDFSEESAESADKSDKDADDGDTDKSDKDADDGADKSDKDTDEGEESDDGDVDDGDESDSKETETDNKSQKSSKGIDSEDDSESDKQMDSSETGNSDERDDNSVEIEPRAPITYSNFEKMADNLVDKSTAIRMTEFAVEPTDAEVFQQIATYQQVFKSRDNSSYYNTVKANYDSSFKEFMASTIKYVAVLKKEFDMRKAAFQYSRASVARTGMINVDKLHSYRTDDDIFLSVTQLADAKNHGMIMFIDYSGSMGGCLPYVLKHLINLIVFCKAVNIPFRVYGFTSNNNKIKTQVPNVLREGSVVLRDLILVELANSDMKKADYNRAIRDLYIRACDQSACGLYEMLGSTPLNETLLAAHKIIAKFQREHPVQKMVSIFLTDGEGQNVTVDHNTNFDGNRPTDSVSKYNKHDINMSLNGRTLKCSLVANNMMAALIENLRITTGSKVMGFFIPGSSKRSQSYAEAAMRTVGAQYYRKNSSGIADELKKTKACCIKGAYKYDDYFVVSGGSSLDVTDENLDITSDMGRAAMNRAFSEFCKSKKVNRVFVTKFADAIA